MPKTLLHKGYYYLTDEEFEKLDRLRGFIPRSKMGVLAVRRLLEDIENNRLELLPTVKTKTTTTMEKKKEK